MDESAITIALRAMETDETLVTKAGYRANAELWPGNTISFVDTHLVYLKGHPTVNPRYYLSNLRLMIRKKP